MMAEKTFVSGSDLKSLLSDTSRLFQNAKRYGKIVCVTCIDSNEVLKFYYDDAGLQMHLKSKHHKLQFDKKMQESMLHDCRRRFRLLHTEETMNVLQQLSNLRLEKVHIFALVA